MTLNRTTCRIAIVLAIALLVALSVVLARYTTGAQHLLHAMGHAPAPVRNLLLGSKLAHLTH